MWEYINNTLMKFRECFSRESSFKWFVIIIIGLMIRSDHLGVTSIIRELGINPKHYESIIHFFRSTSWKLSKLIKTWIGIVCTSGLLYRVHNSPLLIGDGVDQAKEGRKMPGVKKLAQESENSSKPRYIHGHRFGVIGILLGTPKKFFCTILSARLHDSNSIISEWTGDELANESHVVRLVREACDVTKKIGEKCRIALDRYYLTVNALETLSKFGSGLLHIVTKAKKNAIAYEKPVRKHKRGAPPKKGDKVKLLDLFSSKADSFVKANVTIYGKLEEVEIFVADLLWGKKFYYPLRFVLVKYQGKFSILASTDLTLSGTAIIEIYAFRFKIESAFRELKQVIAGFAYRFWSVYMPRLDRFAKNQQTEEKVAAIDCKHKKSKIIAAFNAIEGFAMFAVIACGILQMVALRFHIVISISAFRWLRTTRSDIPSEATTAHFLGKTIFDTFYFSSDLPINRFIRDAQSDTHDVSIA